MTRSGSVLAGLALTVTAGCGGGPATPDDRVAGASLWAGPPGMGYVFLRVLPDADTTTGTDTATDTDTATGTEVRVDRDRPLLLHTRADRWDMRVGEPRWSRGTPLTSWTADRSGGFSLAGVLVIPGRPDVGAEQDGTRVVSVDTVTTWGGTFPDVLTVEVGAAAPGRDTGGDPGTADTGVMGTGDLATPRGTFQFARDLGPVALTLPDGRWELVRWETLPPEATTTDPATGR
ncbi:MAG: hypothetical protein RLZZ299_705 [Pseudomonadota bacterium]|jgi:hypothetical protein